jgi:short subunit dehydrogenase-like uncharacterized protein
MVGAANRGSSMVAVLGASGHTGSFVVDELSRRGLVPVAIGRDPYRLAARGFDQRGVATRTASIDDPMSLDAALDGVAAVVNCAGPFLDTADAVIAAALRAGVHYLDVTAEQASAAATFDRFDAAARVAGVAVVPAMGFFGGLADLTCTAAMQCWDHADEIRIGIALDSWWPTPGTRATGRRNTARRLVIEAGTPVPLDDPAPRTTMEFPAPFGVQPVTAVPFTEVPLIARHLHVGRLHTWLTDTALRDLRDPATPPPVPADSSGRSAQAFLVDVVLRSSHGTRRVTAAGRDIYAVTAPLVVEAVRRCLDPTTHTVGAVAPGQIFDAPDFLHTLTPTHLRVTLTDL